MNPDLRELSDDARGRLARVWETRAAAERGVAAYVRVVMRDLRDAGADANVLSLGDRVCADEDRHAEMCLAIATAYAGREVRTPAPRNPAFAPLDPVPQPLRASLRVFGMCCIGETLAVAWMDASYDATTVEWLRPWVRQHFADEVHHAQLGWAHFASAHVTDGMRRALGPWVVPLVRANLKSWLAPEEVDVGDLAAHGIPTAAQNRALVETALREIVMPGCERVGIDAAGLRELLACNLGEGRAE